MPERCEVQLDTARVRGVREAPPDGEVEVFRGMAYATAQRFLPAELVVPTGELDAVGPAHEAPQAALPAFAPRDEAQCLNLTVWRPADHTDDPLPVVFWIHGGAHMLGSSSGPLTDGGRLAARERLIVVAANYRLGTLGHLWLEDALGPDYAECGNLALLDQRRALEWVQQFIPAFGGDNTRVTIMGESSGGTDVMLHLATDAAGELFHGAIAQSCTLERASEIEDAIAVREQLLAELGFTDASQLLDVPVDTLMAAQDRVVLARSVGRPSGAIPFHPIIDGRIVKHTRFADIASGSASRVPLILGTNRNESSGWIDIRPGTEQEVVASELTRFVDGNFDELAAAYHADRGFAPNRQHLLEAVLTELLYRRATFRALDARTGTPTFASLFDWSRSGEGEWPAGAHHALDVAFTFRHLDDSPDAFLAVGTDAPWQLADRITAALGSFAHNGAPTSESQWHPYTPETREIMVWSTDPHVERAPDSEVQRLVAAWPYRYNVQ